MLLLEFFRFFSLLSGYIFLLIGVLLWQGKQASGFWFSQLRICFHFLTVSFSFLCWGLVDNFFYDISFQF